MVSVAEIAEDMRIVKEGWRKLTAAHVEVEKRFATVDKSLEVHNRRFDDLDRGMQQISQTLARIEAHSFGSKANGKDITGSSSIPVSVSVHPSEPDRFNDPLGYRPPLLPLENRDSLLRKIELPTFDGSTPFSWITRVERFFRMGRYGDTQQLDLVSLSLEGAVLNWFNSEMDRDPFLNWPSFKRRLVKRFSRRVEDEPGKRLFGIRQLGSIGDYIDEFEELSAVVTGLDEKHLVDIFYNGLKIEFQEVVKMKKPQGLNEHKEAVIQMESSAFCLLVSQVDGLQNKAARSHTQVSGRTPATTNYSRHGNGNTTQNNVVKQNVAEGNQPKFQLEETPNTNTKRKRCLGKEKASDLQNYDENLVGSRIRVWWPMDRRYYKGVVKSYDSTSKKHLIWYDDGDREIMRLEKQKWYFVDESESSKQSYQMGLGEEACTMSQNKEQSTDKQSKMDIPPKMLSPIPRYVKKDDEVPQVSRMFAEHFLSSCTSQLKTYLTEAVKSPSVSIDKHSNVVDSICEGAFNALKQREIVANGKEDCQGPRKAAVKDKQKAAEVSTP